MSLTPKDGSDGRAESRPRTDRRGGPSLRARVAATVDGLRALVGRTRTAAAGWFFDTSGRERRTDRGGGTAAEVRDCGRSSTGDLPVQQSAGAGPVRSHRPGTHSDLVAERDGDRLRIRHPDAPGERVESDTWMPVER